MKKRITATVYYHCRACGKNVARMLEAGQEPKRWIKSHCEATGKNTRMMRAVAKEAE